MKAHQRPKLEIYDDTLFVVLQSARYKDLEEEIEFGEILSLHRRAVCGRRASRRRPAT